MSKDKNKQRENKKNIWIIIVIVSIVILIWFFLSSKKEAIIKGGIIKNEFTKFKKEEIKREGNLTLYISTIKDSWVNDAYELSKKGLYKEALNKWENISAKSQEWNDLIKKNGDLIMLAAAYLNYATSYYKEEEYSKKAQDLLNSIWDINNEWYYSYYMWYSYEIIKDYENALKYYNVALTTFSSDDRVTAMIFNQIWHTYDLKWDLKLAYEYYQNAYNLDKDNLEIITNIWRNLVMTNKSKEAIPYFETVVKKSNNVYLKSEIFYTLASLTLFSSGEKTIERAFNYANESITLNIENTNGFMIRWKILYYAWVENYPEAIESLKESIKLYEYNYSAYEILGLINVRLWEKEKALEYFTKSYSVIDKDISLMDNTRSINKSKILYQLSLINSELWNNEKAIENIKEMIKSIDTITALEFWDEIKKKNFWRYSNIKSEWEFLKIINK